MAIKGSQFGRYAQVEIKNFITKELTTIPDDFEIDFEFFKTIDEVDNASKGVVKIKGLTQETYNKINSDGGQIKLTCGYTNAEIKTLFIADIMRMQQRSISGTTETIIECSANLLSYYYTGGTTDQNDKVTLAMILSDYGKRDGADTVMFDILNVDDQTRDVIIQYLTTASFKQPQFFGMNNKQSIEALCNSFGMNLFTDHSDELGKIYTFSLTNQGVTFILSQINEGYEKIDRSKIKTSENFNDMFITPTSQYSEATILKDGSGFLTAEIEYRIANALETQSLAANEEQTERSKQQIMNSDAKRSLQAKKDAEKKAQGKKVKEKKLKVRTIKVNRKYIKIEALLNPNVRPQGHVEVKTKQKDYNGVFRVREATYKGNNKVGNWTMTLFCEDSSGRYDTRATPQDLQFNQSEVQEEQNQVNGELGKNTSYGSQDSVDDQGGEDNGSE